MMDLSVIKNINESVYKYLKDNDLKETSLGRHFFGDHIYANVEEYITKERNEGRYESHRKYIDIQYIISGKEKIIVNNIKDLELEKRYDPLTDICFYYGNKEGKEHILKENDFMILYPEDGHMPCISTEEGAQKVRKIVFKIPFVSTKDIRILFMDIDGTLTDGKIYMGNSGEIMKAFSIKDGCGIADILPAKNIVPAIITGRESQILVNRAKEMKVTHLYQNVHNKAEKMLEICKEMEVDLSHAAYIGDDLNDKECMEIIRHNGGLSACPIDACEEICKIADFICTKISGDGAVRELIDWL